MTRLTEEETERIMSRQVRQAARVVIEVWRSGDSAELVHEKGPLWDLAASLENYDLAQVQNQTDARRKPMTDLVLIRCRYCQTHIHLGRDGETWFAVNGSGLICNNRMGNLTHEPQHEGEDVANLAVEIVATLDEARSVDQAQGGPDARS